MRQSRLNTNNDRRKFWESLTAEKDDFILKDALRMIDPVSAKVLTWHYTEGYSFQEITGLLQRSISTVRNYHNRGMFELQQYYWAKNELPANLRIS